MRRRLFLFFLPSLYANISFGNDASWNCVQDKGSKEWVCVGEKKSANKTSETKAPVSTEPVKDAQSAPSRSVEDTQPTVAEPAQVMPPAIPAKAKSTETAESSQPVMTKTVQDTHPASTETDKGVPQEVTIETGERIAPAVASSKKLSQSDANRPGWTCSAKGEDKNWDCQLVGEDPKGQTHIVESDETGARLLNPAFDSKEEGTFSVLKSQLKYDPWQNCAAPTGTKPGFVPGKDLREASPLDINSDYAEIFDSEIYSYFGNVEMTRADQHTLSRTAHYDKISETLDLQGDVYYSEDELALHSESATLKLASDEFKLRNNLFITPSTPLRGRAKVIYRDSKTFSRYKDVVYTSCRPGNQDWVVHATELKMNKITGLGTARNAWVEFKGTPVFYSPHLSFPIDDRRLSGFLAPSFGSTQRNGLSLTMPYYWNIAPNYDATIRPRYLAKRGGILGGNFRYMTEMTGGSANLELMPHDSLLNKFRYLVSLKNTTQFTSHIKSDLDFNTVSDKDYFVDLGNALSTSTYSRFLLSQANLGYVDKGISLKGHVDSYQSIDKSITSAGFPYRRMPQVKLDLNHAFKSMPLNTALDGEFVDFQHNTLINAARTNIKPSISFPMQTPSAFLTPKLSLQHTQYLITAQGAGANPVCAYATTIALRDQCVKDSSVSVQQFDNTSRTLPIFSTDSGLYMEKEMNLSNRSYLHTLEPRLFYLYIPRKDQSNIAIFDTSYYDFSFNSMFLDNRFSGSDRVQDANQMTAAITTRLVDAKSGKEKLGLSVGEIAYFQDRKVILPGYPVETSKLSPLVADLNAQLTDHVSLNSGMQWDPHLNKMVRHKAALHYINQPGEIFNLGYRYRKNTLIPADIYSTDVSFHWPIYNEWSAVGRWTYSLLNNQTNESFFGAEKENCCWRFRVIGRRWINSLVPSNPLLSDAPLADATGESQVGIFIQIELKGLTGIGDDLDVFFENQIYGYRKPQ
jgi:LPS-assembly protein